MIKSTINNAICSIGLMLSSISASSLELYLSTPSTYTSDNVVINGNVYQYLGFGTFNARLSLNRLWEGDGSSLLLYFGDEMEGYYSESTLYTEGSFTPFRPNDDVNIRQWTTGNMYAISSDTYSVYPYFVFDFSNHYEDGLSLCWYKFSLSKCYLPNNCFFTINSVVRGTTGNIDPTENEGSVFSTSVFGSTSGQTSSVSSLDLMSLEFPLGLNHDWGASYCYLSLSITLLYQVGVSSSINNYSYKQGYDNGYQKGYEQGNNDGYTTGYDNGKKIAVDNALEETGLLGLFNAILSAPTQIIGNSLNFELFGVNFANVAFALITISLIVMVVSFFLKKG